MSNVLTKYTRPSQLYKPMGEPSLTTPQLEKSEVREDGGGKGNEQARQIMTGEERESNRKWVGSCVQPLCSFRKESTVRPLSSS